MVVYASDMDDVKLGTKTLKASKDPVRAAFGYVRAARNSLVAARRVLPDEGCEGLEDGLAMVVEMCVLLEADFYK
jgi:hypothetical protein